MNPIAQNQQEPITPPQQKQPPNKHISFSELKKWIQCPYARKLAYGDRIKLFKGNTYTAFGTALHETIESIYDPLIDESIPAAKLFLNNLEKQFDLLPEDQLDPKLAKAMPDQGLRIMDEIEKGALEDYFGDEFEIVSLEEEVYFPISDLSVEYNFKGFIDMVIKTPDGFFHIIDWKSCTWGWDARRRAEPTTVYQLTYYKNFFAKTHNIDPENIKTYFGLLKRTANKGIVEIFEVTNGKKRTKNALELINRAVQNITSGMCIKNRLSCNRCEFYKTEHCS